MLLGYHTYLLATNQTTWEHVSSLKIDYIRAYPLGYNPFGGGIIKNLSLACLHDGTLKEWDLPDIKTSWETPKSTWWDNEHYNCC